MLVRLRRGALWKSRVLLGLMRSVSSRMPLLTVRLSVIHRLTMYLLVIDRQPSNPAA